MKYLQKIKLSLVGRLIRTEATEERTYFALTIIIGILAGLVTVTLKYLIHFLTDYLGTNKTFDLEAFFGGFILIFISGWITTRYFPSTAGSGVPNVRIALAVFHGKIPLKDTIAKFFTTVLSLGSGVSLGKEGPVVTISSGLGSFLGTFFSMSKKRVKALVAVGSAGGIAAAFNTPITAVVFTMEEIVGDLNAKFLGSIIISSVAASITAQMITGDEALFQQLFYKLNDNRELFIYLTIGIISSFVGPLWMSTTLKLRKLNRFVLKNHRLSMIMTAFTLLALMSLIHPAVLGSGHETLENTLLSLILDWKVLGLLFTLKFLSTSLCYASGSSGGLFMPTLLMGATLGSFIGSLSQLLFPEIATNTGAYALVGMGAFFVSVIRAPFTSILMVFELTRDYNIILPVMIANAASYMLSARYTSGSIYERISEQDGIHLPTREDSDVLESLTVDEAMITDLKTYSYSTTVKEAFELLEKDQISGYPIMKAGRLYGMIARSQITAEMAKKNHHAKLSEICETKIIKIYADQSLMVAFHRLKRFQISRLPVVSRLDDKKILGIITAEDIVTLFGFHLEEDQIKGDESLIKELLEKQKEEENQTKISIDTKEDKPTLK